MTKTPVYKKDGSRSGTIDLNPALFEAPVNQRLLELVLKAYAGNQRRGTHNTKGRAEVRGGGAGAGALPGPEETLTSARPPPATRREKRFEHLAALDAFVRATTSVPPKNIVAMLRRAGTLRLVALSGLFTGILEPQVDMLIVGDNLDERLLALAVRSLEAELGREIRYASFATADFRYRFGVYDRLLRDVFDYPHRLLIDKIGL